MNKVTYDYSKMRNQLVMCLVSTETNVEMLKTIPHKDLEDMSIVYRFLVNSNNSMRASMLITNEMIADMGVTPEQLHADALEIAPQIRPAKITGMSEVIAEMMGREEAEMAGIVPVDPKDEQMFVATVSDKIDGAGVLAYPDFFETAADRMNGSYYIIPSSRNEIILCPDDGVVDYRELEDMVRIINEKEVAPKDRLTDSVYHYDEEEKIFELASRYKERMAERDQNLSDLE